jgi:hypothetical protein
MKLSDIFFPILRPMTTIDKVMAFVDRGILPETYHTGLLLGFLGGALVTIIAFEWGLLK